MKLFHIALLAAVLLAGCGRTQRSETYADGSTYAGDWQYNLPNGQGTATWADGRMHTGEWKYGKPHGQGTWTLANGSKYTGEFKDGFPVP